MVSGAAQENAYRADAKAVLQKMFAYSFPIDDIEVRVQNNGVWLTQMAISELFDVGRSVIAKHQRDVFQIRRIGVAKFRQRAAKALSAFGKLWYVLDKISIINHPDKVAEIIDDKNVKFNGEIMSFNQFGCLVTGWKAIQFYAWAKIVGSDLTLAQMREDKINQLSTVSLDSSDEPKNLKNAKNYPKNCPFFKSFVCEPPLKANRSFVSSVIV